MSILHSLFQHCSWNNPVAVSGLTFFALSVGCIIFYYFDQQVEKRKEEEETIRFSTANKSKNTS
jgi:hypothetical protein